MNVASPPGNGRAAISPVTRFRAYMHRTPWLFHVLRTARFRAMVGPWRPLVVRCFQSFGRNQPIATNNETIFPDFDPAEAARRMDEEGYATGLRLPDGVVTRLTEFFGPISHTVDFNPHLDSPDANAVAHDPRMVELARRYLGAEPILYGTNLWWTLPEMGPQHAHRFHFDVADVRSMAVFFYLTDVDEGCGPHCVIAGTHRNKTFHQSFRLYMEDEDARRWYGDRVRVITGPRGTGFAEEQTIFHKAMLAERHRLVFTVTYTLRRRPKVMLRRNPNDIAAAQVS